MSRSIFAGLLATALLAAALPPVVHGGAAQAAPAKSTKKAKKPPTAGQLAMRAREKQCGAEWRAAKKAGKIEKGMTWPKYWSACNKRLRAVGK